MVTDAELIRTYIRRKGRNKTGECLQICRKYNKKRTMRCNREVTTRITIAKEAFSLKEDLMRAVDKTMKKDS